MGGKITLIIFIVILAGLGLYLITSGAITKGIGALNALVPNSSSSGFFSFRSGSSNIPSYIVPIQPATSTAVPPTNISGGTSGGSSIDVPSTINPADIPAGYTAAQLSPYFHQVRLGSVSSGNFYTYGTIIMDGYPNNPSSSIDISGWQIKSRNSGEYIPQAINIYDASGLTPASDIRVKYGDIVYMYSSSAPFNLRLNECVGYIAHVANFVPALPANCPYVNESQVQQLSDACQNYVNSLGSCQAPNMSSPQISQNDFACQDYLNNNFTYKSCVAQHAADANFLSNQIWVWTGSNVVDPEHDTVLLLDKSGLLVDEYTY